MTQEDWVLCRVFHKGKTDNNMFETAPSPTHQTMPVGYNQLAPLISSSMATTHHHHHSNYQINNQNNNSLMNLLQLSRETTNTNCSSVTQIISPKCDDGYGFLWDMDLEENSFQDGVVASSNLDGMRFEVDNNNNNNSMILL